MAIGLIFKHHRSEGKRKKKRKNTSGLVYFFVGCVQSWYDTKLEKRKDKKRKKKEKKKE